MSTVIAIKLFLNVPVSTCNLCFPPFDVIYEATLQHFILQLPVPYTVVADTNARRTSWGPQLNITRGTLLG